MQILLCHVPSNDGGVLRSVKLGDTNAKTQQSRQKKENCICTNERELEDWTCHGRHAQRVASFAWQQSSIQSVRLPCFQQKYQSKIAQPRSPTL